MTQTGTVLGTSNYIAPEQASGNRVNAHSDVYALGAVLYELLAGEVPFPGESFVAVAMKHVHEPPPNLLDVRKDVPLRVAAAVDRALEKDPEQRFPTMAEFAAELEACLAELEGEETGDATMVMPARRRRAGRQVSRWPIVVGLLALLAIAAIVVGLITLGGTSNDTTSAGTAFPVSGLTSYDPFGPDKSEHSAAAGNITDGNPATYWATESYNDAPSLNKPGVGVVVDAGRVVRLSRLTIVTDTPGFMAQIEATNIEGGTPEKVSDSKTTGQTTVFDITSSEPKRYYVIWITKLPSDFHYAHVNEVRAFKS
jgi:serine/threonine-protein kinase